ncbi:preprotein translocase subunit SecG [Gynuella sunshinyii YC6258]|uniref:Protein-export membrane protein SecG n=2 Tax=Gynuella sunshinyii TaxID=1445505 RepID=A0A0C5W3T9_9GAMM|nr:preprotein translocase subunit SecG [Gynuella sunshinyii YC6258]
MVSIDNIIIIVHVFLAIGVIGFILMQRGKGAEAGASFGSGASQTVFGSQGSANFLSRTTAILATGFFITSLALAYFAKQKAEDAGNYGLLPVEQTINDTTVPAAETLDTQGKDQNTSDIPSAD